VPTATAKLVNAILLEAPQDTDAGTLKGVWVIKREGKLGFHTIPAVSFTMILPFEPFELVVSVILVGFMLGVVIESLLIAVVAEL